MENILEKIKKSDIWCKIHENQSVESIMKYLKKRDLDYSYFDELIQYLVNNHDIDSETIKNNFLISTIMIYKFPDELIGKTRIDEEDLIIAKAGEIYNIIVNGNVNNNLHKKVYTFKIMFDEWKKKDREQQLDLLSEMYYKYSKSIDEYNNDESKEEYIKELVLMKQKIIVSMKNLTSDYEDYLENYKYKNVEYDSSVNKMIYTKLKYVYWENIRKYIFTDNSLGVFEQVVSDYKALLKEIKVIVDLGLLESLEEYDVNEHNLVQSCVEISKAFININKQIDSENYDEIYDMILKKISENNKYLVDGFKICFDRLEIIKKIKMNIEINST